MAGPMDSLTFRVPGRPVPKRRPVVTKRGGTFTPAETRRYENAVGWAAAQARRGDTFRGPVGVELSVVVHRWEGDVDNYAKSLLDGMQHGGLLQDDRQVHVLIVARIRDREQDEHVDVRVWALDDRCTCRWHPALWARPGCPVHGVEASDRAT